MLSRAGVSCALRSSTLPLLPEGQEQTPPGDELVGSSPHPPSLRATLPRQVRPLLSRSLYEAAPHHCLTACHTLPAFS